jgi:glycosyltransferase involved in cell wall biosynthesis
VKILLIASSLPYPAHAGGALRTLGLIRGLAAAGHAVSLLCFHDGSAKVEDTPLAALCQRIETLPAPSRSLRQRLATLTFSSQPDIALRLESAAFRERLEHLLREQVFDLIQFQGLEMAIYLPQARQLQPKARLIYDAFNAEYVLQRRIAETETGLRALPAKLYSHVQARRIASFERNIAAAASAVIAVSPEDAAALEPFHPDRKVYLLPNGIETSAYQSNGHQLDLGEQVLIFTGKMDYRPNVDAVLWFSEAILPRIRDHYPHVKLFIVGQQPHRSLQKLASQPGIEITGWVAEVLPYLRAAHVYVAPMRMGAGTRLKILEAMAAGCAIVATPVAAAGLVADAQTALELADTPAAFANAVIALLGDRDRRCALGTAAQFVVRRHYDWSALIPCLLAIHEEIARG